MWQLSPGSERDPQRGAGDALRWMDDQLLAGPGFPVYGMQAPYLGAEMLAEAESVSAGVVAVGLYCGDLVTAVGPMLYVRTVMVGDDDAVVETDLADVVADERVRLYDHAGIDEPTPVAVAEGQASLLVCDSPTLTPVRREGQVWAARTRLRHRSERDTDVVVAVTVVGRGLPLGAVRLCTVDDLAPYLRGRDLVLTTTADAPPLLAHHLEHLSLPRGFEAHLAFVEASLAEADAGHRAVREGRRYRPRPEQMHRLRQLRELAVRAQMRLATQSRTEAEESVFFLVHHLLRLLDEASWFGDPALRQAAIEESVRFHVFDSDVPSRPAHQAWRHACVDRERFEFLGEWQRWVERRG